MTTLAVGVSGQESKTGSQLAKALAGRASGAQVRTGQQVTVENERIFNALKLSLGETQGGKFVMFASANKGEGKTTVLSALAWHIANTAYRRVLVIDSGTNRAIARRLGNLPEHDLDMLLAKLAESPQTLQDSVGGSGVVVASRQKGSPLQADRLFQPEAMELLRSAFDYILVERPPLASSPAVIADAKLMSGLVIIVEAGRTRWQVVQNLRQQFEHAGGKVLGVVLNKRRYFIPGWIYRWL